MQKRIAMTSPVNGHSHTLVTMGMDGSEAKRGTTSYQDGHTHDWIMDEAGNIEVGHAMGHAHGIGYLVMKQEMRKSFEVKVTKVDKKLGLVFGFACVCLKNGERYFDLQGEHIPEDVMLDFGADFMKNSRSAKAMHGGEDIGQVIFAFPLTTEVAKSLGITTQQTGFLIGMHVSDEAILAKFDSGEFGGFSIGGFAFYQDEVEEVVKADDEEHEDEDELDDESDSDEGYDEDEEDLKDLVEKDKAKPKSKPKAEAK